MSVKIEFISTIPGLELAWPVEPISKVAPSDRKKYQMHRCPGIFDWNTTGYLIRTWTEIHIEPNENERGGFHITVNDREHDYTRGTNAPLDASLVPYPFDSDVTPNVYKIELPWLIRTKPGYSCMTMSPYYHFLDNMKYINVYPGIVDTDGLHRPSVIFSVLKKEHIIIPRGTPLLHIVPFKREVYKSEVKRGDLGDWMGQKLKMTGIIPHWYWKTFHAKKEYK